MKKLLVILCSTFVGLANAQSVDWNRVRTSCSSEASAYDAVRGTGDTSSQAMRFVETDAGSPPSAAKLRAKRDEQQKLLSDPYYANVPVFRLSATMVVCATTAALNQLQNGSTQSASPAPTSGRNMPERYASHCINYVPSDPGAVRNTCNERVNLRWCSLNNNSNNRCGNNNLGWAEMAPGATTYVDGNVKSYVFGCFAPAHPSDVEYTPGRGLQAYCKQ